ncbi:flagellar biosynthesis protein FlgL [Novosphingobium sp. FSW06-99]|uniref:flagellin N-terminal helical domain-containing protein n=1 Tax=Novosphingobium sp. FSW06-99 TaxID=1739113 RepID=UPI00076BF27B|nr:flagellar biosynthesis protein FlgL [Novosphingobium sp. FSW06-99]KUR71934.1 flagellar biosynthesis protein FlgL [Novosphingobium sp. FSW06-99]
MTTISSTSTASFYTSASEQLSSLQAEVNAVDNSISTGSQYTSASQDPEAAAQMRMLQLQDSEASADKASSNLASTNLGLADSTMTSMINDINEATQLTNQAATGTLTDTQRASIGTQIAQIQQNLVSLANTHDANGNALFGGGVSGNAYTLNASGTATYVGAATSQTVPIGGGQSVQVSLTGPEILGMTDVNGNQTDVINTLGALSTALKAGGSAAQTAASSALTSLQNGLDAVTTAQTVIGSRESWVSLNAQNQTAATTARATEESQIGDTDVSTAAIKLQDLTTALQASQACFVRLSSLSLFSELGN